MADDLANYAAPGLRWGLINEDYPSIKMADGIATASELGIPARVADPDEEFVYATVIFPPESEREPVTGYKPWTMKVRGKDGKMRDVNVEHQTDHYQTLVTKALGRALKRCGYPDDLDDLRALLVWRQRLAELGALAAGTATVALESANVSAAIDGAGKREDDTGVDDGGERMPTEAEMVAAVTGEPVVEDAVLVEGPVPATKATVAELRKRVGALDPETRKRHTAWCREQGIKVSSPATEHDAQRAALEAIRMLADVAEAAGVDTETGEVRAVSPLLDGITMALEGLSPEETRGFGAYCQTLGVDTLGGDLSMVDVDTLHKLAAWLDVPADPTEENPT